MASLTIAYILWLFGGWFGLHHFYLGRDNQALIWWATLGGGFGIGWLRDIWRMPDYVRQANKPHDYIEEIKDRIRKKQPPRKTLTRSTAEVVVSAIFGYLAYTACPEDIIEHYWSIRFLVVGIITPLAAGYGVYMVGNIGEQRCGFKVPVLGSFVGILVYWNDPSQIIYSSLISSTFLYYHGSTWKPLPKRFKKKTQCLRRTFKISMWCTVYILLWSSALYFNFKITTSDGEEVKFSDAVSNFFKSPAWVESKESFWALYDYVKHYGWTNLYYELLKFLDPEGVSNAYKVLEVNEDTPTDEIKAKYRKLVRQWHPDKHQDPIMKEKATKRFMEIQTAYDTLTKVKSRGQKQQRDTDSSS